VELEFSQNLEIDHSRVGGIRVEVIEGNHRRSYWFTQNQYTVVLMENATSHRKEKVFGRGRRSSTQRTRDNT
jgi:hypothetical protein